jgi:hypothetical protein
MNTGRHENIGDIGAWHFSGSKLPRGYGLAKKTGFVCDCGLKEQNQPGTIWRKITLKQ